MAVSYNGLWKLLIDKKMKKVDMMNQVGISSSTVAKMTNDELVSLKVLEKICEIYVDQKDYDNALVYIQKGIEQGGESKASFMYGKIVIYENAQEYDKAYEAAKKYVELYPDDEAGKKEYTFLSTRI